MLITIFGDPIPQSRPRTRVVCGRPIIYDSDYREKQEIRRLLTCQLSTLFLNTPPSEHAKIQRITDAPSLCVSFLFYCNPPEMSQRDRCRASWDLLPKTTKPDLDNYVKFYLDCLSGIVFKDDNKIVSIHAKKLLSHQPKVVIKVEPDKSDINDMIDNLLGMIDKEHFHELAKTAAVVSKSICEAEEDYREVSEADRLAAASVLVDFAELFGRQLGRIGKNADMYRRHLDVK